MAELTWVEPLMGLHTNGRLFSLPTHIRLGWKCMAVANLLQYGNNYICKKFYSTGPGCHFKRPTVFSLFSSKKNCFHFFSSFWHFFSDRIKTSQKQLYFSKLMLFWHRCKNFFFPQQQRSGFYLNNKKVGLGSIWRRDDIVKTFPIRFITFFFGCMTVRRIGSLPNTLELCSDYFPGLIHRPSGAL